MSRPYDAFPVHVAHNGAAGPTDAMSAAAAAVDSYPYPYPRPVPPSSSSSSSSLHLFDETATSWLLRDSSHAQVPDAIRHLQGSVQMWDMIPCFDATNGAQSDAAPTTFASFGGGPATTPNLQPRLHAGEVLELYGRSNSGKTEVLYQCLLHAILPKSLTSSILSCVVHLGGLDSGAIYFDFDGRFSIDRLKHLHQAAVSRAARVALLQQHRTRVHELDNVADTDLHQQVDGTISAYLASDEYATLLRHCLAAFFVFHAQTPRQALAVLVRAEELLQDFGRTVCKRTWASKEQEKERKRAALAPNAPGADDVEMKSYDPSDPLFNPPLSSLSVAAAAAASDTVAAPPRMALLLVDNIAAFYWQVRSQPIGWCGIGTGLYSKERMSVGAHASLGMDTLAAAQAQQRSNDSSNSWFYEMFTHQMRYIMQTYHLIGVVAKPTCFLNQIDDIHNGFVHKEYLGLTWNSLVTYRLVLREEKEAQQMSAKMNRRYVAGSHEAELQRAQREQLSQRGSLRGASLKVIKPVSSHRGVGGPPTAPVTMEFQFRIGNEGVKPTNAM